MRSVEQCDPRVEIAEEVVALVQLFSWVLGSLPEPWDDEAPPREELLDPEATVADEEGGQWHGDTPLSYAVPTRDAPNSGGRFGAQQTKRIISSK